MVVFTISITKIRLEIVKSIFSDVILVFSKLIRRVPGKPRNTNQLIISVVAYAGYLGFRVNLENFHHPIGIDFVRLDTIDYIKDHLFGHFPINYRNSQVREAFYKSLPEGLQNLEDSVQDYFTHLECTGPKLAHYAGYIIANNILPWVEPGYREDYCQTLAFTAETEKYMGYLPL